MASSPERAKVRLVALGIKDAFDGVWWQLQGLLCHLKKVAYRYITDLICLSVFYCRGQSPVFAISVGVSQDATWSGWSL